MRRVVDDNLEASEFPVGLYDIPNTSAKTLYSTVKDVLAKLQIPLESCRGKKSSSYIYNFINLLLLYS